MGRPERSLLETLARRTELVERIREGIGDKRDLTDRLDVSRTTVDRAIRELESEDLVERTEEGYALTLVGELAYAEFRRLMDRFETLDRARELLVLLPREFEIDPAVLEGAEIVPAERPMPHEPLERLEELIREHERVSCYSSVAFPSTISVVHRQITETETEVELLLDGTLVDWLEANYDEGFRDALAAENATIRRLPADRGLEVVLALFDERVVWIGLHHDGDVRGSITAESTRAVEWARERLDRCREAGREVEPSE